MATENDILKRNRDVLLALREQVQKPRSVIPFIGAGLSHVMGLPLWRDFLSLGAQENGCETEVAACLDNGDFEGAARELFTAATEPGFQELLTKKYGDKAWEGQEFSRTLKLLPRIGMGKVPVVTTNFDGVLKRVFEAQNARFDETILGGDARAAIKMFREGDHCLLKLHGDYDRSTGRVLTLEEYRRAYGKEASGQFDPDFDLPSALATMFTSHHVLFLGCGLTQDRPMALLLASQKKLQGLPHYAFVSEPNDRDAQQERRRFLNQHFINPIWYPEHCPEFIEPMLQSVIDSKLHPALAAPPPRRRPKVVIERPSRRRFVASILVLAVLAIAVAVGGWMGFGPTRTVSANSPVPAKAPVALPVATPEPTPKTPLATLKPALPIPATTLPPAVPTSTLPATSTPAPAPTTSAPATALTIPVPAERADSKLDSIAAVGTPAPAATISATPVAATPVPVPPKPTTTEVAGPFLSVPQLPAGTNVLIFNACQNLDPEAHTKFKNALERLYPDASQNTFNIYGLDWLDHWDMVRSRFFYASGGPHETWCKAFAGWLPTKPKVYDFQKRDIYDDAEFLDKPADHRHWKLKLKNDIGRTAFFFLGSDFPAVIAYLDAATRHEALTAAESERIKNIQKKQATEWDRKSAAYTKRLEDERLAKKRLEEERIAKKRLDEERRQKEEVRLAALKREADAAAEAEQPSYRPDSKRLGAPATKRCPNCGDTIKLCPDCGEYHHRCPNCGNYHHIVE